MENKLLFTFKKNVFVLKCWKPLICLDFIKTILDLGKICYQFNIILQEILDLSTLECDSIPKKTEIKNTWK